MIAFIALLRPIPYLLVAVYAWRKGYRWLTFAGIWVSLIAIINFFDRMSPEMSGVAASIFALLLLFHALDLKPKQGR
ncbi:hypothetical protein AB0P19_06880 [Microbacterium oleivorans]|uniref:hypothetical protein n=1 Tax=Microbacterium oleivorans TaxID=273677 RepID=UPI00341087C7